MLSQKRCEHTFRTCPSPLYLLLQPQRIRIRIPSPAIRPTQALLTPDLGPALEHLVRSLIEDDHFPDPLIEGAGDVHTAHRGRGRGRTHDLCLHGGEVVASHIPPALPDNVDDTLTTAAHGLRPLAMARAELVALLTLPEAVLVHHHDKHVGEGIHMLQKGVRHLRPEMDEAVRMIPRVDLLLL